MKNDLIITLQNYGFSEKEAKVYLTLLEIGSAPASTIARRSNINRVTVYSLLNEMKKRGFITENITEDIKYYVAISPELLLDKIKEKFLSFEAQLPNFLTLINPHVTKPKIIYLEGEQGLKNLFIDFANSLDLGDSKENMRVFLGTNKKYKNTYKGTNDPYRRAKKKYGLISQRIVSDDNVDFDKEYVDDEKYFRETRFVDHTLLSIKADINIYGKNKTSILFFDSNQQAQVMIIESDELHQTMKGIFDFIRETLGLADIKPKK